MNKITAINKWVWNITNIVLIVSMIVMISLVFINVVLRYLFGSSFKPTSEVSRFLFVWVTMLGASIAMRHDDHLNIRIIENFLPLYICRILRQLVYFIIMLCSLLIVWGCVRAAIDNLHNISPLSRVSLSVNYFAGIFAGIMMAGVALYRIIFPYMLEEGAEK